VSETSPDTIFRHLSYVARVLREADLWHCAVYGTLLGGLREGDVIPWDDDFDFLVRPRDVPELLALDERIAADGYAFRSRVRPSRILAVRSEGLEKFWDGSISVFHDDQKVGDLYCFTLCEDGVLRRLDVERGVYWVPRSSFPAWFVEARGTVRVRDLELPAPRDAEKFLAGVYGEDWHTPYRAPRQGGKPRKGATIHGDRYAPKLHAELAWCRARGFDASRYRDALRWPRPLRGAGPIGPTPRTRDNSRSLWWRDLDELVRFY